MGCEHSPLNLTKYSQLKTTQYGGNKCTCFNQDIQGLPVTFQKLRGSRTTFPVAAPLWTRLSHPVQREGPLSRSRKPRWWLPGIHSFSGTWIRSCGADWGICVSEVGGPQAEAEQCGASALERGPPSHPGRHRALFHLLPLHVLCSPSWGPAECVHWGTKRK